MTARLREATRPHEPLTDAPMRLLGGARQAFTNAASSFALGFLAILLLGANSAGYWPTAWGWASLALLFVAGFAVALRSDIRVSRAGVVVLAGLSALLVWTLLSSTWSSSPTQPVLSGERLLVYVAAVAAVLVVVRAQSYRHLLAGTWAAVVLISGYGLLTRLFPERLGTTDLTAGYRLEAPLGYWNALGIFTVMGALLSFGFAARARHPVVRALAGATTVVLLPTMYFTFSRGAWISLAVALVVLIAMERRRLQMITTILVVAPWPAIAIWRASHTRALTTTTTSIASESSAGHRYFLALVLLGVAAGAASYALAVVASRVHPTRTEARAYTATLVAAAVVGVAFVFARFGSPIQIVDHAYRGFVGQSTAPATDLNNRLFNLAGGERIPQWKIAWRDYASHPLLGSGAGTYARYWNQLRPAPSQVINVHNLYLETLAELGPVGLLVLVSALAAPFFAAIRARRHTLVAAATAAYAAFLIHAAVDWDWQMPAVTLVALFCAGAIVVSVKDDRSERLRMTPRWRVLAAVVVVGLAMAAFVGLRGNQELAASRDAAAASNWAASASAARSAADWAPWSSQPPQLIGEAQAATGDLAAARASFADALAIDRADWTVWLDLAIASGGSGRARALSQALRLNPLSPEIASWRAATAPVAK